MYEGLLACADCAGIHTRLTLDRDGSFAMVTRRMVRDAVPDSGRGRFEWESDGNTLVLDREGGERRFAVGEGRLQLLETGQMQPAWDRSCEPPLMEADAALAARMAEPIETVLVRGAQPRLVWLTRAGDPPPLGIKP